MSAPYQLTPTLARRMAVIGQRLAGPPPGSEAAPQSDRERILSVIRSLGCLQLDPISAVAPSHLLVLWSRLGQYDPVHLETLLWEERRLFEYWAHAASIVLSEDYPIHQGMMRSFPGRARTRDWLAANANFRQYILEQLREEGPLTSKQFEDKADHPWQSTGWTAGRNVGMMLDFLWSQGYLMVAGRKGRTRLWDLAERCLPNWTPRESLSEREIVRRAAQKALRALGVARPRDIENHFIRGRYPDLVSVLAELETEGQVVQAQIVDHNQTWPGPWYIHTADLSHHDRLAAGRWQPRTTLLSPFDNLICDRKRTEDLFAFRFRLEIYVPKAKRQYGYYVLPILHGERLIGRLDPKLDRKTGRLTINAIFAEPDAPQTVETGQAIAEAIKSLATFIGAKDIILPEDVPAGWKHSLVATIQP